MQAPVSPDNISSLHKSHLISPFPLFIFPSESSHIFSFSLHLLISSYHLKLVIKPHPCTNRLPPIFYFMYLLSSSLSFSFSPLNFCFSPRRIISYPSSFLTHKNFSIFNMKKILPEVLLKVNFYQIIIIIGQCQQAWIASYMWPVIQLFIMEFCLQWWINSSYLC